MSLFLHYPTAEHEQAAQAITEYFSRLPETRAVLLVNSCARGKATRDSCLDIVILVGSDVTATARGELAAAWEAFYREQQVFRDLESAGKFSEVHLDIIDGKYKPTPRDWTGGPDSFELEIGNHLAYSVPLWERDSHYQDLKARWLPYYGEALRRKRLAEVKKFFGNNLEHIPLYVARGLYFQAFDRLYNAYREFLQALFISRRTYPIAYDKWIQEQVQEILCLPQLYPHLPHLFEIYNFQSRELVEKADALRRLFDEYVL